MNEMDQITLHNLFIPHSQPSSSSNNLDISHLHQQCYYFWVTKKKHANWLCFREIIQPNLPKFAYNLLARPY